MDNAAVCVLVLVGIALVTIGVGIIADPASALVACGVLLIAFGAMVHGHLNQDREKPENPGHDG